MIEEQVTAVVEKLSPIDKMRYFRWKYERLLNQAISILAKDVDVYKQTLKK